MHLGGVRGELHQLCGSEEGILLAILKARQLQAFRKDLI